MEVSMDELIKNVLEGLTVALIGLFLLLYLIGYLMTKPTPNRSQLCHDLAAYIEMANCMDAEDVTSILAEAFESGVTTRQEVNATIGQYQDYIHLSDSGRAREDYTLESTWLGQHMSLFGDDYYSFWYDENGVLTRIRLVNVD
jgi:hypothetical protein